MTARITLDPAVTPVGKGWRVTLDDGTHRMVLPRHGNGWAVFDGVSTDALRNPPLGYSGSWARDLNDAIEWAKTATT